MTQNKQTPESADNFTGNFLGAVATVLLAHYLEPYLGYQADWVLSVLYVAAALQGITAFLCLVRFWRNQRNRYRAYNHSINSKGSARWATSKDIKRAGLYRLNTCGVFLGTDTWGNPINDRSESHIMVEAPTGSGKTSGFIKPNVFHNDQSQIIIDINGDIAKSTVHAVQKYQGKDVIIVDPMGVLKGEFGKSARYNPLSRLVDYWQSGDQLQHQKMVIKISEFVHSRFPKPKGDGGNDHFRKEAIKWVECLISYMVTHLPAEEITDTKILEILRSELDFEEALQIACCSNVLGNDLASMAGAILGQLENKNDHGYSKSIRDVALQGFNFATRSGALAEAVSKSDFSIKNLQTKPTNLYLIIPPDMMQVCKPFVESFFWAVIDEIISSCNKTPLLFLCDEATNFKIPDMSRNLTLLRNYYCKFIILIQDHKEYANVHGDAAKDVLFSQTGTKLITNPQSPSSMDLASQLCGDATIIVSSSNTGKAWTDPVSTQTSEQNRKLLTPSEAREACYCVIIYKNLPPIKAFLMPFFLVSPWQKWGGESQRSNHKTLLSLRYRILHHVLIYYMRMVLKPYDLITLIIKSTFMAPVKVIYRFKTSLNPFRFIKRATNTIFTLLIRLIEWLLPYSYLIIIIWLFVGQNTPHILIEENGRSCTYRGIEGYKTIPNHKCLLFRMLP